MYWNQTVDLYFATYRSSSKNLLIQGREPFLLQSKEYYCKVQILTANMFILLLQWMLFCNINGSHNFLEWKVCWQFYLNTSISKGQPPKLATKIIVFNTIWFCHIVSIVSLQQNAHLQICFCLHHTQGVLTELENIPTVELYFTYQVKFIVILGCDSRAQW